MLSFPTLGALDRSFSVKVYLCTAPTDMRKGFDTLAALVKEHLGRDPLSGDLFLFLSRGKDRLKAMVWEHDGFCLLYKRLEAGTYRLPPHAPGSASVTLTASELAMLLDGIDLNARRLARWNPESNKGIDTDRRM